MIYTLITGLYQCYYFTKIDFTQNLTRNYLFESKKRQTKKQVVYDLLNDREINLDIYSIQQQVSLF